MRKIERLSGWIYTFYTQRIAWNQEKPFRSSGKQGTEFIVKSRMIFCYCAMAVRGRTANVRISNCGCRSHGHPAITAGGDLGSSAPSATGARASFSWPGNISSVGCATSFNIDASVNPLWDRALPTEEKLKETFRTGPRTQTQRNAPGDV